MKTLSTEQINEIRNSVDIVDIVSRYISLTKKGKNYFGVCPFHEDSDPSLSVSPDKQIFSCFSCHTAGNVFNFLMEYEHISFIESVKMIADISGISVNISTNQKVNIKGKNIYDIYEVGQKVYINNINTQLAVEAKKYLNKRSINDDMIKEFEIGLAIKNTHTLSNVLVKKEFDNKDLIDSGLIVKDEQGFHDFFYNRIMFPLHDTNGRVIGYSGRLYDDTDGPKYINSKEHPLFKKGEFIYNYEKAKNECRSKNTVIIMEGFMDVIRAYSVGVKNVVATLGTAFTKEHANMVKRLASNIIICYDGDKAGEKATFACCNELLNAGITPKIIRLEENLDPDEYILKYGKDRFLEKVENPLSIMDFKLLFLKKNKDLTQTTDKAKYANEMILEINKIDDDILREVTLKKLSQETDLDIEFLRSKLDKKEVSKKILKKVMPKTSKYVLAQVSLLYYMLRSGEVIKMFDSQVKYLPVKNYRLLAQTISHFYKNKKYIDIAELLIDVDDETKKTIGEVESLNLKEEYTIELIQDYIDAIKEKNIDDETERLQKQLQQETDFYKQAEIGQRVLELSKMKNRDIS